MAMCYLTLSIVWLLFYLANTFGLITSSNSSMRMKLCSCSHRKIAKCGCGGTNSVDIQFSALAKFVALLRIN